MSIHQIEIQNTLARRFGEVISLEKKEVQVTCPFCGGNKKLWINIDKKVVHCFKCNFGSGLQFFFKKIGETVESSVLQDPKWSAVNEDVDIVKHVDRVLSGMTIAKKSEESLSLPAEIRYFDKAGEIGRIALEYLRRRGIYTSHIQKYKLGYCASGQYKNRVIIPCFMDSALVYFQGRAYYASMARKYMNPAVNKSGVLFNYDNLSENSRAIIVEGVFDAIKGGDGAIAILGKTMSAKQKRALLKKRPKEIVIMLDPDALTDAMDLARELVIMAPVRVVTKHTRDAGSMSQEEVLEYVAGAKTPDIVSRASVILRRPRKF